MPAGDPVYAEEVELAGQAPIGRCVASGTQALADDTQVAILFTTEEFDSHNQHSTSSNTSRITPNVPGIYSFDGTVFFGSSGSAFFTYDCNWRLNGSTNLAPADRKGGSSGVRTSTTTVEAISLNARVYVAMNGTTDYVELVVRVNNTGGGITNQSSQFSSVVQWKRERALI